MNHVSSHKSWKKPKLFTGIVQGVEDRIEDNAEDVPKPHGTQIEALYELKKSRFKYFCENKMKALLNGMVTFLSKEPFTVLYTFGYDRNDLGLEFV